MTWKLWLDDQMMDPNCPNRHLPVGFIGATSSYDALVLIKVKGMPEYIDFDHDLGGDDDAIKFINKMIELYPNGPVPEYQVHSENRIGAKNIVSKMYNWKKFLAREACPMCLYGDCFDPQHQ